MTEDAPHHRPRLRVVGGNGADAPPTDLPAAPARGGGRSAFVCTWCALRFATRSDLDRHRSESVECRANQAVSSPLQTRYGDADMVWTQPGEMTLNRVRAAACRHTHPRARLVDAAGQTIGYQCGWCYGILRDDLP